MNLLFSRHQSDEPGDFLGTDMASRDFGEALQP